MLIWRMNVLVTSNYTFDIRTKKVNWPLKKIETKALLVFIKKPGAIS